MLGYMMFGTKDLEKAAPLYDALAAALGGKRTLEIGDFMKMWGAEGGAMIALTAKPANGEPPSVGNGVMGALYCPDTTTVDALYKIAMDHGCQDEGGPGERGPGFYAAYFRDMDGNKLAAFHANHG